MTPGDPLAVYKKYKDSRTGTHFIKSGVEKCLNEAGQACYAADVKGNRFHIEWTYHSDHIGTTMVLFANHQDPLLLKNRLRRAYRKFEVYTRHTLRDPSTTTTCGIKAYQYQHFQKPLKLQGSKTKILLRSFSVLGDKPRMSTQPYKIHTHTAIWFPPVHCLF